MIPQGEAVVIGIAVSAALWALRHVLAGVLEEVGAASVRAALGRISAVSELAATSTEWRDRLARPDQFVTCMRRKPRTTKEAAELLHCSPEDAKKVLWGKGVSACLQLAREDR